MKIYHEGELIFMAPDTSGILSTAVLPNLVGDGRTLLVQGNLVGWFTPLSPEDEIRMEYGQ